MVLDLNSLIALLTGSLPGDHYPENMAKSTDFHFLQHTCEALPILVNHLTSQCGFSYVLTYFLQTDPSLHFGLYRMMSGSNYHVSFSQILETERRIKVSSILKLFSQQPCKEYHLKSFFKSFTSDEAANDSHTDLNPFLSKLQDMFTAILANETIQSLAFIAGYCVHQFFKSQKFQNCRLCLDFLTADRDILFDPE